MNCDDYLSMLDEYVENELDQASSALVSAHIGGCPVCSAEYETLRREQDEYSQYFAGVEPSPALWTRVRTDIENAAGKRSSLGIIGDWLSGRLGFGGAAPAFATALLVIIGIVAGSMIFRPGDQTIGHQPSDNGTSPRQADIVGKSEPPMQPEKIDQAPKSVDDAVVADSRRRAITGFSRFKAARRNPVDIGSRSAVARRPPSTYEAVEKAEQQYRNAVAVLSADIRLARKLRASDFARSIADIDRTIAETRRAVRVRPADPVAIQYMTAAYSKKIELLRTIAAD